MDFDVGQKVAREGATSQLTLAVRLQLRDLCGKLGRLRLDLLELLVVRLECFRRIELPFLLLLLIAPLVPCGRGAGGEGSSRGIAM
jgi:hypothetical protein